MIKTDSIKFICLGTLTLLGETVLTLSFSANTANDILGIFLAFLLSACVVFLTRKLISVWERKSFKYKRPLSIAVSLFSALLFFTVALFTAYEFSRYAAQVMLSVGDLLLPFVTFSFIALLYAKDKKLLFKTALLLFPIAVIIILLIFGFSLPFMSLKYLIPYKYPSVKFAGSFFPLLSTITLSALPLTVLCKKQSGKAFSGVFFVAFVLLSAISVNVIALFGSELASTLSYPYSEAVSTATLSQIFSRMDGFLYALSVFTCLIKTTVSLRAGYYLLKSSLQKILY